MDNKDDRFIDVLATSLKNMMMNKSYEETVKPLKEFVENRNTKRKVGVNMTQEETTERMQSYKKYLTSGNPIWNVEEVAETFDAVIRLLEKEPCEDAISRKAVIERVDKEREYLKNRNMTGAEHILTHHLRNVLDDIPTVTPTRPKAKWIMTGEKEELYCEIARCSSCGGETINNGVDKFCPDCGAEMESEK